MFTYMGTGPLSRTDFVEALETPVLQTCGFLSRQELSPRGRRNRFILAIDQGVLNVADAGDVFYDRENAAFVTGMDTDVQNELLEKCAVRLSGDVRANWNRHNNSYTSSHSRSLPVAEGITKKGKRVIRIPDIERAIARERRDIMGSPRGHEETGDRNSLASLYSKTVKILVSKKIRFEKIPVSISPWIQDFFIPFEDGSVGIPPHFEERFVTDFASPSLQRARSINPYASQFAYSLAATTDLMDHFEARGIKIRVLRTFIENGNALFHRKADGTPVTVLGRNAQILTTAWYQMLNPHLNDSQAKLMLAEDTTVQSQNLIVLPQAEVHVDMFVRPGKPGEFFVANYDLGEKELVDLVAKSKSGEKAKYETLLKKLRQFRSSSLGKKKEKAIEDSQKILVKAGFSIVDYPSIYVFTGQSSRERRVEDEIHVNTMNNRYGLARRGRVTNLVLSSGMAAFDEAIENFERKHGSQDVLFLGRDLVIPNGNRILEMDGGIGCFTNY